LPGLMPLPADKRSSADMAITITTALRWVNPSAARHIQYPLSGRVPCSHCTARLVQHFVVPLLQSICPVSAQMAFYPLFYAGSWGDGDAPTRGLVRLDHLLVAYQTHSFALPRRRTGEAKVQI